MSQRDRKREDFQFPFGRNQVEEKRAKSWLSQFASPIVLAIFLFAAVSVSAAFIVVSELIDRVAESDTVIRELEARTSLLLAERAQVEELLREQLSNQSAANAEQLREYEETIARLQSQVDELSQELRAFIADNPDSSEVRRIDEQIGESRSDLARLANAVFFVSIYYNGLSQETLTDINNTLFAQMGFNAQTVVSRQWVSGNAVFFYDDFSRQKANELAETLSEILGVPVLARIGAGRGITEEERRTAIIVHLRI